MKIRNLLILCSIMLCFDFKANAKQAIDWLTPVYDFGIIQETDGLINGEFTFVNTGEKDLIISKVLSTCGCTHVDYPQKKIISGDTAVINVIYDPLDRPGKFDKGVHVFFENDDIPTILRIKGTVMASPETLLLFYPKQIGQLNFEKDNLDFGEMSKGIRRREFIDIYNSGQTVVSPVFVSESDALSMSLDPPDIEPGENATLTVYIDSSRLPWLGKRDLNLKGKWEDKEIEIKICCELLPYSPQALY